MKDRLQNYQVILCLIRVMIFMTMLQTTVTRCNANSTNVSYNRELSYTLNTAEEGLQKMVKDLHSLIYWNYKQIEMSNLEKIDHLNSLLIKVLSQIIELHYQQAEKCCIPNLKIETHLQSFINKLKFNYSDIERLLNESRTEATLMKRFIAEIKIGNDKEALKIFQQINEGLIEEIVNKICTNSSVNDVELLVKFVSHVTSYKRKLLVFNALFRKIKTSTDKDKGLKILVVIKELNRYSNEEEGVTDPARTEMLQLMDTLNIYLKQINVECVQNFLRGNYSELLILDDVLNMTFSVGKNMFEDMYKEVLIFANLAGSYEKVYNNLYSLINIRQSLDQNFLFQKVHLFIIHYFDNFSSNYKITSYMNLRSFIKELKSISKEALAKYKEIFKPLMPSSMFSLVFSDEVCAMNVALGEYLQTNTNSSYSVHDKDRRNVYTDKVFDSPSMLRWQFEHLSKDIFSIYSVHFKEYMYTAINSFTMGRRRVWMWVPGWKDDTGEWQLELSGQNVRIRSAKYYEYLYGSDRTKNEETDEWQGGHVYTQSNARRCNDRLCLWNIVECKLN